MPDTKQSRIGFWPIITGLAAAPFVLLLINFALRLVNESDDLSVVAGYGIFAVLIILAVVIIDKHSDVIARWLHLAPIVALLLLSTGCYKTIEPGRVGITVKQTGGDRGVQDIPSQSGRVFYNPINEYVLEYPTSVQRAIWTQSQKEGAEGNEEIAFQSSDSLHFTGDVAVAYHLPKERVPHFYVQFRTDDLTVFTHGFFRDAVRKSIGRAATKFTAEEINGGKQADLEHMAQEALVAAMQPYGVQIDQLAFTAPPRPPPQVKTAIEAKIAAIQSAERVENQKREASAEGEKIKVTAAATAEANRLINSSITPQLVEWKKLDIMGAKWDGRGPMVTSSASGMILDLKAIGK
jgi:regulator of protease activity HflC (stomatin/prohibitin superfamily)